MISKTLFDGSDPALCFVFRIPGALPKAYCFGGGLPVTFQMVDWFSSAQPDSDYDEKRLRDFLLQKNYVHHGCRYLVLLNNGDSFVFEGREAPE